VSRNLGQTSCHECSGGEDCVVLEGPIRPVTELEDPAYFRDHEGLLVAEARCVLCHTLYIAWVDWPGQHGSFRNVYWSLEERRLQNSDARFVDLSYRHAFNDEPAVEDLPLFTVETVLVRRPIDDHRYAHAHDPRAVARWRERVKAIRDRPIAEDLALVKAGPYSSEEIAALKLGRTWVQACALHDDCRRHPEVGVVCLARRERGAP